VSISDSAGHGTVAAAPTAYNTTFLGSPVGEFNANSPLASFWDNSRLGDTGDVDPTPTTFARLPYTVDPATGAVSVLPTFSWSTGVGPFEVYSSFDDTVFCTAPLGATSCIPASSISAEQYGYASIRDLHPSFQGAYFSSNLSTYDINNAVRGYYADNHAWMKMNEKFEQSGASDFLAFMDAEYDLQPIADLTDVWAPWNDLYHQYNLPYRYLVPDPDYSATNAFDWVGFAQWEKDIIGSGPLDPASSTMYLPYTVTKSLPYGTCQFLGAWYDPPVSMTCAWYPGTFMGNAGLMQANSGCFGTLGNGFGYDTVPAAPAYRTQSSQYAFDTSTFATGGPWGWAPWQSVTSQTLQPLLCYVQPPQQN
jgi:hypothetical protein